MGTGHCWRRGSSHSTCGGGRHIYTEMARRGGACPRRMRIASSDMPTERCRALAWSPRLHQSASLDAQVDTDAVRRRHASRSPRARRARVGPARASLWRAVRAACSDARRELRDCDRYRPRCDTSPTDSCASAWRMRWVAWPLCCAVTSHYRVGFLARCALLSADAQSFPYARDGANRPYTRASHLPRRGCHVDAHTAVTFGAPLSAGMRGRRHRLRCHRACSTTATGGRNSWSPSRDRAMRPASRPARDDYMRSLARSQR
mmetsp:Transcript_8487/g.26264  ORF Transcript_8487/g.26264 Transcript_8487/m.26264 type:complete len:261 (+) Transcript_8487:358-1140(+)